MIRALAFESRARIFEGRPVRKACFEPRSALPLAAACVVANGIRETLAVLVAKPVRLRLMEPVCPEQAAWSALTRRAQLYEVRGALNTATFVLQIADAVALARLVFNESSAGDGRLSRIEEEVVGRVLRGLAAALGPLCGQTVEVVRLHDEPLEMLTFFEVLIEEPARLRLGLGLKRDAITERGPTLAPEALLEVKVRLIAQLATVRVDAKQLLALRPGSTIRLDGSEGAPHRLVLDGSTIAFGTCGARGERRAFAVGKSIQAAA